MRGDLALLRARFAVLLQYRAAAIAGVGTQLFWGFIRIMILTAFYRSSTAPQPIGLADVVTYIWLGQALIMLLPWRPDPEMEAMVRTGDVAYELLRPVDLYRYWFVRCLAFRTAPTLLRCGPILLLAIPFFGLRPPASVAAGAAFVLSLVGAIALAAALTTRVTIFQTWTITGRGAYLLMSAFTWVFSGMLLPLQLFPDWAAPVVAVLPFRGLMDTPFRLWMGHMPIAGAPAALLHQVVWVALLVLLGRALMARARHRLVVQGG